MSMDDLGLISDASEKRKEKEEAISVSLINGGNESSFTFYFFKKGYFFLLEFHFKLWKSFAGTNKTRKKTHYQMQINVGWL